MSGGGCTRRAFPRLIPTPTQPAGIGVNQQLVLIGRWYQATRIAEKFRQRD